MGLRPYQQAAIERTRADFNAGIERLLVVMATGLGKTVVICNIPTWFPGKRSLVMVHTDELCIQAKESMERFNPALRVGIEMGSRYADDSDDVIIASPQTLGRSGSARIGKFRPDDFGSVILDECFPAGTLVDGIPIEKLRIGDSVSAFNEAEDEFVDKKVTHLFKRKPSSLLTIHTNEGKITCTHNHPILTKRGWVSAVNIRESDEIRTNRKIALRALRNGSYNLYTSKIPAPHCAKIWTSILQERVYESASEAYIVNNSGTDEQKICFRAHEEKQPYASYRSSRKSAEIPKGEGTQTQGAGRKWARLDGTRGASEICYRFGIRVCNSNQNAEGFRFSDMLQAGFGRLIRLAGGGSRRRFAHDVRKASPGQKERGVPVFARVDRIEVHQQGSDGTFGGMCPDGFVYNLEVEDLHTYTANGFVVHNCHHGTSDSYIRVLEHFGFMSGKKTGRLLYGTTATPDRSDGVGLSKIFDKISYNYGLLDAIRDGWLCNLRGVRIKTSTNLDDVRTSGEDFNLTDLSLAVNTPERNRLVVEQWLKAGERRKTLGFSAGVQHAKDLAAAFRAQGVKAQAVWGEDNDRKQKIADHKSGAIEILLNDSLLTEGYDDRSIECVLLARPVRSKLRYQQMLGRGTRLPHGVDNLFEAQRDGLSISKTDCLVLDLSDSTTKHSLVGLPTLFGLPEKLDCSGFPITEAIEKIEEIKKENPDVDLSDLEDVKNITTYLEHIDLFNVKYAPEVIENSALQWHKSSEGKYVLLLPSNESVTIAENLIGKYEIRGVVNGNEFEDSVGALSDAFNCADSMVKYLGGRTILSMVKRDASKKKSSEPMTPKQKRALAFQFYKRGKAVPNLDGMSKHQASKLLSRLHAGQ